MRKLYLMDFDGTLAIPQSGETFRKAGEHYIWMYDLERPHSSRKELLEHLYLREPCHIAVATNQGGIAYGILRQDETEEAIFALLKELPFPVHLLVCPFHEARYPLYAEFAGWRKPLPGMLMTLFLLFPGTKPEDVLVVGDRPEDEEAALVAGFAYQDAETFFTELERDLEAFIRAEQTASDVPF